MIVITAAALDLVAALLHLAIIVGGPAWYRFFGAGEDLASMAERGHPWPTLVTAAIAAVLTVFALYTASLGGHGWQAPPLQREGMWLITGIYTLRAAVPLLLAPMVRAMRTPFMLISSGVCALYAIAHALALAGA